MSSLVLCRRADPFAGRIYKDVSFSDRDASARATRGALATSVSASAVRAPRL